MRTYHVNTRGPGFFVCARSVELVADWVDERLPLKRGYTRARSEGERAYYTSVLNTKGRLVNGASIQECNEGTCDRAHRTVLTLCG